MDVLIKSVWSRVEPTGCEVFRGSSCDELCVKSCVAHLAVKLRSGLSSTSCVVKVSSK